MKVHLLISTIFPRLCERALMTAAKHGADVDFVPVIVGPESPRAEGILFVEQKEKLGSNSANRLGLQACDDDAVIVLAADDVVFKRDWLAPVLANFIACEKEMGERPFIMGVRHAGGIGTTYGHMYANFPMFRKSMLGTSAGIAENFCPEWLIGQWGDCAFGMGVWRNGGVVVDSGTEPVIKWSERMGFPESPMKYTPQEADMEKFMLHFADFAHGWPRNFRGFNIDCNPAMLRDGTICERQYERFVERYNECR